MDRIHPSAWSPADALAIGVGALLGLSAEKAITLFAMFGLILITEGSSLI